MQRMKKAGGGNPPATTTRQSEFYSRPHPASSAARCGAWLDRAAVVLAGLLANLQEAIHLSPAEREGGWAVFAELLAHYVTAKHQRAG